MSLLDKLKQRKLVQWALAYVAFAFALLQGVDIVAQQFAWPDGVQRAVTLVLILGFFLTLLLAWYHGEQGRQRASGTELLLIALVLAVGGGFLWQFTRAPHFATTASQTASVPARSAEDRSAQTIPPKSIAVLPFENLSTDQGNKYFADGMQDLILTKLADIGQLKVISRTSTLQYGSHPQNLEQIGQELGVATLLEGSVQKAGDQVLINVQLINAKSDAHIWAQSYQRKLDNIFGVEGEVAGKIADALKAKLSPEQVAAVARAPTTNPQAYTLYLKANEQIEQFLQGDARPEHAERAITYLEDAVKADPKFALAWAKLASMQEALVTNQMRDTPALRTAAMTNVHKALALQPDLAAAHEVLGFILVSRNDNANALKQYQIARGLVKNDARLAELLTVLYASTGKWSRAASENARALRLDPRNSYLYQWASLIAMATRHYASAVHAAREGVAISPQDSAVRSNLAQALSLQGYIDKAHRQLALASKQNPSAALYFSDFILNFRHDPDAALHTAEHIPSVSDYAVAGSRESIIGRAQLALGQHAEGQTTLDRARDLVNAALASHPDTPQLYESLAKIQTWRGNMAAALRAAGKALMLLPRSFSQRIYTPEYMVGKAAVLAHFRDALATTTLLRKVLQMPGGGIAISPAQLRLDATWDPIRKTSEFQALLKKYAADKPAHLPDGAKP